MASDQDVLGSSRTHPVPALFSDISAAAWFFQCSRVFVNHELGAGCAHCEPGNLSVCACARAHTYAHAHIHDTAHTFVSVYIKIVEFMLIPRIQSHIPGVVLACSIFLHFPDSGSPISFCIFAYGLLSLYLNLSPSRCFLLCPSPCLCPNCFLNPAR